MAPLPKTVHITRTGGFAGLSASADVETDALSPDEQSELSAMLTQSGKPAKGADRFTYEAHVGERKLRIPEPAIPAWLKSRLETKLPGDD